MPEGRQSPPPERQTGAQQQDPTGSGNRTSDKPAPAQSAEDQLKGLESNPKGAMDDALKDKFAKTEK